MKANVLYTNGERTIELFWLKHTGTDVYCGTSGSERKRSYHQSGKVHTKQDGDEVSSGWVSPLKELKGAFHLSTICIHSRREWADAAFQKIEYKNSKVDSVLYVDARSIPDGEQINVEVGLLEPNNLEALNELIKIIGNVKQVSLSTDVMPWVFCMLIWPIMTEPNIAAP